MGNELEHVTLHSSSSWGHLGQLNIKIEVEATRLPEITDEVTHAVYRATDAITAGINAAIIAEDPKTDDDILENKKLTELFVGNIFVDEIPNGYTDAYYSRHLPWFKITTRIGHFTIGWRKRVIHIDWSETIGTETAEKLFNSEDVTTGDKYIHAWTIEKAREYIEIICSSTIK